MVQGALRAVMLSRRVECETLDLMNSLVFSVWFPDQMLDSRILALYILPSEQDKFESALQSYYS
jgi:hypothetical protein